MNIAIISDSHDNLTNIYKALDWMNKNEVREIIHCGDICAPGALREIANNFKGEIHIVYGNVDGDREGMEQIAIEAGNVIIYGETGEIISKKQQNKKTIKQFKIAFTHFPWTAKNLAKTGKYHYVFYGHTHKPWEESCGNCKIINPGTLAGMFYKATFAIFNTESEELSLKILEKL
ncbi:MAG: YfcE family phosphodiesterase [bacterium]